MSIYESPWIARMALSVHGVRFKELFSVPLYGKFSWNWTFYLWSRTQPIPWPCPCARETAVKLWQRNFILQEKKSVCVRENPAWFSSFINEIHLHLLLVFMGKRSTLRAFLRPSYSVFPGSSLRICSFSPHCFSSLRLIIYWRIHCEFLTRSSHSLVHGTAFLIRKFCK